MKIVPILKEPILQGDEINIRAILGGLLQLKWLVIVCIIFGMGAAVAMALNSASYWTSTSKFVSTQSKGSTPSGSLSSLASLAGIDLGGTQVQEAFYEDIVRSKDFLDSLMARKWPSEGSNQPVSLFTVFQLDQEQFTPTNKLLNADNMRSAALYSKLLKNISFSKNKSGMMSLSVTMPDPVVAYEFHMGLLVELERFNRHQVNAKAKQDLEFIDAQLKGYQENLAIAEQNLTRFRTANIMIATPEYAQRQSRLEREVTILSTLVIEFRKQYELSRMEEQKSRDYITIIESPNIPQQKSKPQRRKMVLAGFAGGLAFGFALAVFLLLAAEVKARFKED